MLIEFDESRATGGGVVDRLVELDRIIARLHAVQADLLVEVADAEPQELEVWVGDEWSEEQRRLLIEDPIRDELACALHRSAAVMQGMIDTARWLAGPLRPTWQALHEGRISMAHVRILVEAAEVLPEELLAEFQARVLPRACDRTLAATRRAVRETARRLDREGCERRRRQSRCSRDVGVSHEADGISVLWARLATEQALAVMASVDAVARARRADAGPGSTTRMGEHRADALTALVLGGGAPTLRAHLNLTIDLPTLLGLQEGTAELAGDGAVTVDVVRDLLTDPDCAVTLRRLITDPLTGHLLDYGRRTYAIPQRLRDYIIARDKTCRFPGCNRRADLSQIDHALAYADGGSTKPENLGCLCIRHHQLKTFGGWEIIVSRPDGTCQWRSPHGRIYESHDPPPDDEPPDPAPPPD